MRTVYLVFRLSYVIDGSTILPVLVKEFADADEARAHVKAHGGFMVEVEIGQADWDAHEGAIIARDAI